MDIEKFNPTITELNNIVATAKTLTVTDFEDAEQIAKVKDHRLLMRDTRVSITKRGKELREEAVAFQKAVITKEKELIEIITPEEERLQGLEDEAKRQKELKVRMEQLPVRKEKIAGLKLTNESVIATLTDEYILSFNADDFQGLLNKLLADKNEADRAEIEARERVVREAEEKTKRDAEIKEREENARQEEREKLEREQKMKEIREEEARKAEIAKAEQAKKDEEERKKRERMELERDEKYQAFLKEHGYSEEVKADFVISKTGNQIRIYKLSGTLSLE